MRARDPSFAVRTPAPGVWLVLALLVLASVLLGLFVGRANLDLVSGERVVLTMRAHRLLVAFLSGASLSVCGAVVQTLFRNPLASPTILGTTAGATLGAHVALLSSVVWFGSAAVLGVVPEMLIPIGATFGAALSLFVLLAVVSLRSGSLTLLLVGFALMSLFQGVSLFLTSLHQEAWELTRAFSALSQGNISSAGPRHVLLVAVMTVGACVPIFESSATLDVLLSGEEEAQTLGVDVKAVRFWLVVWVAIATAGAVAVGGSVGFVGLIVPHALRPWVGHRHRFLLPAVFVAGGCFVVLCDVLCRIVPVRSEIPLGVLIDLIGAPVFLRMLLQRTWAARHD
jgi:iron complex transport system permease protein